MYVNAGMQGTEGGGPVQLGGSEWGGYGSFFGIMLVTFYKCEIISE